MRAVEILRGALLRNRMRISIAILTFTSLVIFVTLTVMFTRLDDRQRAIDMSVREGALISAFQADREAQQFILAVLQAQLTPTPEALADVSVRYDVLYSRATTLKSLFEKSLFGDAPEVASILAESFRSIFDLAPVIDSLVGDEGALRASLPMLREAAVSIRGSTDPLVLKSIEASNAMRVSERALMQKSSRNIAIGVLILTLALAIIVALLIVQLIHSSRTGRRLEVLSERNAKAAEAAEAGNKAKTTFLTTMSHEIRSPLNGIVGMTDVLAATNLSPEQAEQVGVIRQSGELLLDVINDVLDFSKLESGHVEIVRAPFAIAEMIGQVRTVLGPRAQAKGLDFVVDAPDVEIVGDAAQLRQVLVNFVGNAIKFTEAGSIRVEARLREGGWIEISVEDTGIGIAADGKAKLFKEFSQVDGSVTRRFGGTGLGLAICKRLIEAMGGTVGVESAPGRGSRFWFAVPAGPIRAAEPRAAEPQARLESDGFTGRVLVVEDNAINRKVAGGLLERAKLSVDYATDGVEALVRTESQVYDLVLMDMQMPVLDGLGATRAMRARGYRGPIVGLTANAFVSDREACLAAGMDDFMAKPVTWNKLRDQLRRWLPASGPETVAPDAGADAGEVDGQHRAALTAELGAELVDRLIADFAVDSLRMLAEARAARAAGDEAAVDALLHTVKGAGQTLGFVEIGRLAQAIRSSTDDGASFDRLEALVRATAQTSPERLCA